MITFKEFITKWEGKLCDWDGRYGGQCVDLYRQYCNDVLGLPQSPAVVGAKNIWDTYLKDKFDRFDNSPTAVPKNGDIIIWNNGTYGHVAIFIEGDVNRFTSFDENFPDGALCAKVIHSYLGVLGWLRAKPTVQPEVPYGQLKIDLVAPYGTQEVQAINSMLLDKDRMLKADFEEIKMLNQRVNELEDNQENFILNLNMKMEVIDEIRAIVYGRGWTWVKINNIKKLLN